MIPNLAMFAVGLGKFAMGVADILRPMFHMLGFVFSTMMSIVGPAINGLVWALGKLATGIGWVLSKIGQAADEAMGFDRTPAKQQTAQGTPGWLSDLMLSLDNERLSRANAKDIEKNKESLMSMSRKAPASRSGTNVTQDFRYSKFTIDQKFETGFDPDRIAVLFAKEISNVGTQKLQSGFEPLFALRI
jgi:hypothetical protein